MRLAALFCLLSLCLHAAVPAEVAQALATFRADGPKGWAFTQTTVSGKESTVEHFDPALPVFTQWTLVAKNGAAPSEDDITTYQQMQSRGSSGATAPTLTNQLDLDHATLVSETADTATYHCQVRPGESSDDIAEYLQATIVYHKPTHTIRTLMITSTQAFSPSFGISISEMKTTMSYTLPKDGKPSLLEEVTTHVRGRAFVIKSLDADMSLTYSDYKRAGRAAAEAQAASPAAK